MLRLIQSCNFIIALSVCWHTPEQPLFLSAVIQPYTITECYGESQIFLSSTGNRSVILPAKERTLQPIPEPEATLKYKKQIFVHSDSFIDRDSITFPDYCSQWTPHSKKTDYLAASKTLFISYSFLCLCSIKCYHKQVLWWQFYLEPRTVTATSGFMTLRKTSNTPTAHLHLE